MRTALRGVLCLLFALGAGACGGTDAQCAIDSDCPLFSYCDVDNSCRPLGATGDAGGRGEGGIRDAGEDTDGGGGGTDAGPEERGIGNVTLTQVRVGGMVVSASGTASFTAAGGSSGCTQTTMGDCTAQVCTTTVMMVDAGMVDAGVPPAAPHAGQIDVTGGLMDVMLTADAMTGFYAPFSGAAALWDGTQMLTVAGAGDTVPMFDGVITPPGPGTVLTEPALPAPGTALAVDRAAEMTVSWTIAAGLAGRLITTLSRFESGGMTTTTASVTCSFDLEVLTGTVPSALLGMIPMGAMGTYSISAGDTSIATPTGWDVTLTASESVADMAGTLATGTADFM